MTTPRSIYEKFTIGDHLTLEELQEGFDHFYKLSTLLSASGPVFHLSAVEANRVAGEFNIFLDNRQAKIKADSDANDRDSKAYQDGYTSGIVWTDSYRPGGPFHYPPRLHETNAEHIRIANNTLITHRRWMLGFDAGLADKKAGIQPKADLLKCDPTTPHEHSSRCLKR